MLDKEELTPLLSHTRHSLNNYSSQLQSTSQTMPVYHRTHHRTRHRTHHRTPAQQRTPARQFKLDTVSNTQKWATIKLSIISFVIIVWVLIHYLTQRGHTTETTTSTGTGGASASASYTAPSLSRFTDAADATNVDAAVLIGGISMALLGA
jgi:hypothetical protein